MDFYPGRMADKTADFINYVGNLYVAGSLAPWRREY
jgi:hypothetical protein